MEKISLSKSMERSPARIFPHALAHRIVNTALGETERHAMLAKWFNKLSPADQIECRAEILAAKRAKLGECPAEVRLFGPFKPTHHLEVA